MMERAQRCFWHWSKCFNNTTISSSKGNSGSALLNSSSLPEAVEMEAEAKAAGDVDEDKDKADEASSVEDVGFAVLCLGSVA